MGGLNITVVKSDIPSCFPAIKTFRKESNEQIKLRYISSQKQVNSFIFSSEEGQQQMQVSSFFRMRLYTSSEIDNIPAFI